ncbi:MAG: VOC family protein [Microbacteriaceae bacterium]
MVIDTGIYLMVLTRDFFATFTDKSIIDTHTHAQVQVALSRESREDVDAMLNLVLAAGGTEPQPAQDYGFMYSRDFEDPDGNHFSALWMDPVASEQGPEAYMSAQNGAQEGVQPGAQPGAHETTSAPSAASTAETTPTTTG